MRMPNRKYKPSPGDKVLLRVDVDGRRRAGPGIVEAVHSDGCSVRWVCHEHEAAPYRYPASSLVPA